MLCVVVQLLTFKKRQKCCLRATHGLDNNFKRFRLMVTGKTGSKEARVFCDVDFERSQLVSVWWPCDVQQNMFSCDDIGNVFGLARLVGIGKAVLRFLREYCEGFPHHEFQFCLAIQTKQMAMHTEVYQRTAREVCGICLIDGLRGKMFRSAHLRCVPLHQRNEDRNGPNFFQNFKSARPFLSGSGGHPSLWSLGLLN